MSINTKSKLPATVVNERVAAIHAVRKNPGGTVVIEEIFVVPVDRPGTETCTDISYCIYNVHVTQVGGWRKTIKLLVSQNRCLNKIGFF